MPSSFISNGRLLRDAQASVVNLETLKPADDNEISKPWLRGGSVTSAFWKQENPQPKGL